jgi:ribosomal protein S27AE
MLFDSIVFEDRFDGLIVMSYPSTEVICGKCGTTLSKVINLRPVRDILRTHDSRCKACGNGLNSADFMIEVEKL